MESQKETNLDLYSYFFPCYLILALSLIDLLVTISITIYSSEKRCYFLLEVPQATAEIFLISWGLVVRCFMVLTSCINLIT